MATARQYFHGKVIFQGKQKKSFVQRTFAESRVIRYDSNTIRPALCGVRTMCGIACQVQEIAGNRGKMKRAELGGRNDGVSSNFHIGPGNIIIVFMHHVRHLV